MSNFDSLGIRAELVEALRHRRIEEPTPIQEKTIPVLLTGKDVVAQAQTGTGKTFAFLLPIFQKINTDTPAIQALIVTPTRELALQITTEAEHLTHYLADVKVLTVYGGQDVERQVKKLNRAVHLVVGTPGRILDHVRRATIDLSKVSMLVLDEADQMLQFGFLGEVESIIQETSPSRQTMLFSATMPGPIRSLAKRYMQSPQDIRVKRQSLAVDTVRQVVVQTTDRAKQATLRRLIDEKHPYLAMIFCRTKRRAKTLCEALQAGGYLADELHGDLSQAQREQVVKRFRSAEIQLLVATDVAARGLDVEGVTHVFNYDIPHDFESYIHRIGRTGRAGEEGVALTLVAPKDKPFLVMIEKGLNQSLEREDAGDSEGTRRSNGPHGGVGGRRTTRHGDGDVGGRRNARHGDGGGGARRTTRHGDGEGGGRRTTRHGDGEGGGRRNTRHGEARGNGLRGNTTGEGRGNGRRRNPAGGGNGDKARQDRYAQSGQTGRPVDAHTGGGRSGSRTRSRLTSATRAGGASKSNSRPGGRRGRGR